MLESHAESDGSRTHLGYVIRTVFIKCELFNNSHRKEDPVSSSNITLCPPMVILVSH